MAFGPYSGPKVLTRFANLPDVTKDMPGPGRFMLVAVAGAALANMLVWFGVAWRTGFFGGEAERLSLRLFVTQGWWRFPAAALLGLALHRFHARLLEPGAETRPGLMLLGVIRAFVHFPLYGLLAMLGMVFGFLAELFQQSVLKKPAPRPEQGPSLVERWLGEPVWFVLFPYLASGHTGEGDMRLPRTVSRRRLLRWLPAIGFCIALWTNAHSEDSGRRVDPLWLAAFASYWLGEYLLVALHVAPLLRARRGLPP